MTHKKIKIALIGCGRISAKHFEAIKTHNDSLELVAVCDSNPIALEKATQESGVSGYSNLDTLLKNTELDLAAICTPSGLHAQQVIQCAQAGCHVMTEKPMATRWKDGLQMVKACDDASVHFFVVKQNRRNATIQLLKKAIDKGRFGKISTSLL